jgi:hypothetical protein
VAEPDQPDTSMPGQDRPPDPYPPRTMVTVVDHNGRRVAWTMVGLDDPTPTFTDPALVFGIESLGWSVFRRRVSDPMLTRDPIEAD